MSPSRLISALAPLVLVGGAAAVAATTIPSGTPGARLAVDTAAPLFSDANAANLLPGDERTACLTVTNAGRTAAHTALYVPGIAGELAKYLQLTVTRGRGSCDRFAADGRVFFGRLDEFPDELRTALIDPEQWAPGDRHAYRFALRLVDDPGAAGRSARWDWRLAADALPLPDEPAPAAPATATAKTATALSTSAPASTCSTVQLAGTGVGTSRKLTRTVRVSAKVRAELVLRTYGAGSTTRVVVTTGLRVRGNKTLLTPGWAKVRYRVEGRQTAPVSRRPFRARVGASSFRPGTNRISVAVQKARGGSKKLASFSVTVTQTTIAGRTVCVVSA